MKIEKELILLENLLKESVQVGDLDRALMLKKIQQDLLIELQSGTGQSNTPIEADRS